jgi:hypothetical protein
MSQTIRVPKEVMEIFYEMLALEELMDSCGLMRKLYYTQKYKKAYHLAWRALGAAHPAVTAGEWQFNATGGFVTKIEPKTEVVKKTRQRKPKVAPLAPSAVTEVKGEVK